MDTVTMYSLWDLDWYFPFITFPSPCRWIQSILFKYSNFQSLLLAMNQIYGGNYLSTISSAQWFLFLLKSTETKYQFSLIEFQTIFIHFHFFWMKTLICFRKKRTLFVRYIPVGVAQIEWPNATDDTQQHTERYGVCSAAAQCAKLLLLLSQATTEFSRS